MIKLRAMPKFENGFPICCLAKASILASAALEQPRDKYV
jgi:hypothetical protein